MDERSEYYSFLLRLWRVEEDGKERWRASLQVVGGDKRRSFESLEALLSFLGQITGRGSDQVEERD